MATFEPGDVLKVPFPYAEWPVRERRPALVVSTRGDLEDPGLVWVLMITSSSHRRWAGDVLVSDQGTAGLPAPSVVRTAKIATIEAHVALPLGRLVAADLASVRQELEATWNVGV